MIKSLISLPYAMARRPFDVVDKLATRLPDNSFARLTVDRSLATADKVAGAVLRNEDLTRRGDERLERSSKLATAADLEEHATTRRKQAQAAGSAGRQEAADKRAAARDRLESGLEEADEVEKRGKQQAAASARKAAAQREQQAERRAAQRKEQVEKDEARVKSAAAAKREAAQRRTKAELDDARETQREAAEKRAEAGRLEDLTEATKAARQQD